MAIGNEKMTERLALVSTLDPVSQSAATVTSDVIDMKLFKKVLFILSTGSLGTSATVDLAIKGDTTSGGGQQITPNGDPIELSDV